MAISGDYPSPVTVNGFSCRNCTDVDYAKKHIDPAHPKDGPYGIEARRRAEAAEKHKAEADPSRAPAVILSGRLAHAATPSAPGAQPRREVGAVLDVAV